MMPDLLDFSQMYKQKANRQHPTSVIKKTKESKDRLRIPYLSFLPAIVARYLHLLHNHIWLLYQYQNWYKSSMKSQPPYSLGVDHAKTDINVRALQMSTFQTCQCPLHMKLAANWAWLTLQVLLGSSWWQQLVVQHQV